MSLKQTQIPTEGLRRGEPKRVKLCKRGHQLWPKNIYLRPDGGKACRKCIALADKRYYAKKKALARQLELLK